MKTFPNRLIAYPHSILVHHSTKYPFTPIFCPNKKKMQTHTPTWSLTNITNGCGMVNSQSRVPKQQQRTVLYRRVSLVMVLILKDQRGGCTEGFHPLTSSTSDYARYWNHPVIKQFGDSHPRHHSIYFPRQGRCRYLFSHRNSQIRVHACRSKYRESNFNKHWSS